MHVGTIKEIWRFPVTSMGGERISAANIDYAGFADDRTWAIRDDETNESATARRIPKLMMLKARTWLFVQNVRFCPVSNDQSDQYFQVRKQMLNKLPMAIFHQQYLVQIISDSVSYSSGFCV